MVDCRPKKQESQTIVQLIVLCMGWLECPSTSVEGIVWLLVPSHSDSRELQTRLDRVSSPLTVRFSKLCIKERRSSLLGVTLSLRLLFYCTFGWFVACLFVLLGKVQEPRTRVKVGL